MGLDEVLVVVGASLLVLGLLSRVIKRLFLSTVLLALLIGVAIGPEGLGVIEPPVGEERKLMEQLARLTLAIALMGTGLAVTRADLRENLRSYASLLTVGMIGMWVVTGLGAWLLLGLPFWAGFLLGAILTPTDPVVASALVTGPLAEENLPRRVRRTLQIEAGETTAWRSRSCSWPRTCSRSRAVRRSPTGRSRRARRSASPWRWGWSSATWPAGLPK